MHMNSSCMEENRSSKRVGIKKVGTEQSKIYSNSERGANLKR